MIIDENFVTGQKARKDQVLLSSGLSLVKMKEKKLLKIQPLPKVLRVQAIKAIYNCYIHACLLQCYNEREESTQNGNGCITVV
jgi:hypothetical protein